MEAKKFRPAVQCLVDFSWTRTTSPLHSEDQSGDIKEVSISDRGGRDKSTHQKQVENTANMKNVEACNDINHTSGCANFEGQSEKYFVVIDKPSKKTVQITKAKPLDKTVEIIEVKPSKKTIEVIEVKPKSAVEIMEVKPSKETIEVIEVKSSEKIVEITEVKPSEKIVEITAVKPSEKIVQITEVKPFKKSVEAKPSEKADIEIIEVKPKNTIVVTKKPSKKTAEYFEILKRNDSNKMERNKSVDMKLSRSKSVEGDRDLTNSGENEMETIKDLFKKYISDEYLDFLDSSLPLNMCCEEKVSKLVPQVMSEEHSNNLSSEVQKSFQSKSSLDDSNTEPKVDLINKPGSRRNENSISWLPVSTMQTSSVTPKEALVTRDENTSDQSKRYSLRRRRNKSFTIYDDTNEWIDQLDFIYEKIPYTQVQSKQMRQQTHQRNDNFRKTKENCGQSKDHNGGFVVGQTGTFENTGEESRTYKYIPRKRKSLQSYICMSCHMNFKSETDLTIHKALKCCEDMYRCVVCGDIFSSIENLCIHGSIHNVFFCSICGRCYKTKTGLNRHQYDHTGYRPYSCSKCSSTYKTKNELAIHNMYHTGDMPFHCHICSKGFPTIGQIKRHFTTHDTMNPDKEVEVIFESFKCYECKTCGNIFNSQELLQSHEHIHFNTPEAFDEMFVNNNSQNYGNNKASQDNLNMRKFENQCRTASIHQSELQVDNLESKSHMSDVIKAEEFGDHFQLEMSDVQQLEEREGTFQSPGSDEHKPMNREKSFQSQFSDRNQLEKGKKNMSSKKSPYKCVQCSEVFESHMAYLYHRLVHNRDAIKKPHKCDKCPMIFHLETSLMSHQLIHREPRTAVCDTCGRTFGNQLDLVYHKSIHNPNKLSLKCSKCPKVFDTKKQLNKHIDTHSTDRKLFPCETCSRIFQTRSGLARHRMDHTGERRFSCQVCEKKFKTSTQLRCHASIHTGIRPYSCKICGKSFPIKSYLSSHLLTHK